MFENFLSFSSEAYSSVRGSVLHLFPALPYFTTLDASLIFRKRNSIILNTNLVPRISPLPSSPLPLILGGEKKKEPGNEGSTKHPILLCSRLPFVSFVTPAGNDVLQGGDLWTCSYHYECGHSG